LLNAIRAPMGALFFVAPLPVLLFSRSLVPVTAALVAARLVGLVAHAIACRRMMPPARSALPVRWSEVRQLFRFGAWMSVSNVVSPVMVYMDRFVIGAILSVAAVAYYATPYEAITKVFVLPTAILGVLFPAFAASYRDDRTRVRRLFAMGTKYVALLLFPLILLATGLAYEGLRLWLGQEFAVHSAPVLRCLAIGIFINGVGQVFSTLLQGIGRPDLTAKLHLIELPLYLALLWWAIHAYGIVGAAIAWTSRTSLDCLLLFWLSSRFAGYRGRLARRMGAGLLLAIGALALPLLATTTPARVALVVVIGTAFVGLAWNVVLTADERGAIMARLRPAWSTA
jgi:O-antigen/teichoic acid export membrane protein